MKLLLDENVPRQLKMHINRVGGLPHEVYTVREKGWNGKSNGELLQLMLSDEFDGLITADKNLQHQQNFDKYPIPVVVLSAYRLTFEYLQPLIPKLHDILKLDLPNGPTTLKCQFSFLIPANHYLSHIRRYPCCKKARKKLLFLG